MEYKLLDSESNEYELNGTLTPKTIRGSMARLMDTYSFNQEIIERSYLPGSVVVGSSRVVAKEFNLVSQFSFQTDTAYDAYLNELLFFLEKATIVQDITNEKQSNIVISNLSVTHEQGSIKRSGNVSIVLTILDGFWTGLTEESIADTLVSGENSIVINNDGYLVTYGKIALSVGGLAPQIDMYIDETKEGLQLIDNTLGQAEFDELVVDNKEGTLTIAAFDRSQNITDGTGYFPFPTGTNTLIIDVPVAATVVVTYFKRFYV